MQIKQNRAIHFTDGNGVYRCGIVRDFEKFEDGGILISVTVKGQPFLITNEDIVLKPSPRWCD